MCDIITLIGNLDNAKNGDSSDLLKQLLEILKTEPPAEVRKCIETWMNKEALELYLRSTYKKNPNDHNALAWLLIQIEYRVNYRSIYEEVCKYGSEADAGEAISCISEQLLTRSFRDIDKSIKDTKDIDAFLDDVKKRYTSLCDMISKKSVGRIIESKRGPRNRVEEASRRKEREERERNMSPNEIAESRRADELKRAENAARWSPLTAQPKLIFSDDIATEMNKVDVYTLTRLRHHQKRIFDFLISINWLDQNHSEPECEQIFTVVTSYFPLQAILHLLDSDPDPLTMNNLVTFISTDNLDLIMPAQNKTKHFICYVELLTDTYKCYVNTVLRYNVLILFFSEYDECAKEKVTQILATNANQAMTTIGYSRTRGKASIKGFLDFSRDLDPGTDFENIFLCRLLSEKDRNFATGVLGIKAEVIDRYDNSSVALHNNNRSERPD